MMRLRPPLGESLRAREAPGGRYPALPKQYNTMIDPSINQGGGKPRHDIPLVRPVGVVSVARCQERPWLHTIDRRLSSTDVGIAGLNPYPWGRGD
jgi:hypothetical protein